MGSMNTPNSWAPYYTYKDCSQGICSIYCPQWCYLVYPPPPPFSLTNDDDDYPFNFSPLIIAVIGILSSAILLIAYYTVLSKYCRRRTPTSDEDQVFGLETNQVTHHDHYQESLVGLDESTIKAITVFKYKIGDGSVDEMECSVCLSEFQENEDLRLLPKCNHSFHIVCIDTWLKSHSNCPLCRASVVSNKSVTNAQNSTNISVSTPEVGHQDDVALVAENGHDSENDGVRVENREVERPSSLSVADILRIREEEDDDIEMGVRRFCSGVGSSQGDNLMKNG